MLKYVYQKQFTILRYKGSDFRLIGNTSRNCLCISSFVIEVLLAYAKDALTYFSLLKSIIATYSEASEAFRN